MSSIPFIACFVASVLCGIALAIERLARPTKKTRALAPTAYRPEWPQNSIELSRGVFLKEQDLDHAELTRH